jgi:tetratricopeptide (TPR) repeat protein
MSLEEEIIQTEEFVKTRRPLTDSAHRPTTLAALKARRESRNHDVQPAVPLQPSPANQLRHAQQLIRSGEYEDAVTLLSPLFHDPPVKWQPWFWMGTALLGKGDMEQADQFFLSGLARNDKVPQLWVQRALVAQQRGDYQLAIHELRQAESLDADIPHIHLNMGYAYEQLGNDRMANQYYGKFLKLSENNPTFFSTRKKLYARLTRQTPTKKPSPPSSPGP